MSIQEPTVGKLPERVKPGQQVRITFNMHKPSPKSGGRWQETRFVTVKNATDMQAQVSRLLRTDIAELWEKGSEAAPERPASLTVAEYAERYFEAHVKPFGRVNSMANVRSTLDRYIVPALGTRQVASLTSADLRAMQTYLRESMTGRDGGSAKASSIGVAWKRFMAFINAAVTDGVLVLDARVKAPIEVKVAAKQEQVESWDDEEIETFVRCAPELLATQEGRMALTALYTGLRPCELLALEWRDVKWADEEIDVTHSSVYLSAAEAKARHLHGPVRVTAPHKTRAGQRRVALHAGVAAVLHEQHRAQVAEQASHLVFTGSDGGFLLDSPSKWFADFCASHGLRRIVFYSLRHCFATLMLGRFRVDWKTLQAAMGHENIEVTIRHYCHLTRGMQDAAKRAFSAWVGEILGKETPIEVAVAG